MFMDFTDEFSQRVALPEIHFPKYLQYFSTGSTTHKVLSVTQGIKFLGGIKLAFKNSMVCRRILGKLSLGANSERL